MHSRLAALTTLLALMGTAPVAAQTDPVYIQFSPRAVKGALYAPDAGPAPSVGLLMIHRTSNYLGYHGCAELSARGFLVLCMNPRSDNNEARALVEEIALDVKSGLAFLRAQAGIQAVLLYGFSGGGPTTTFYQAVAEQGVAYCQAPGKLTRCSEALAGLPPADGLILVDNNPGNAASAVRRINPAVTNDAAILDGREAPVIDPSLDPFRVENGYNPDGASTYSEAFRERYFIAQAERMNGLIELAQTRLREIEAGAGRFADDDVFVVARADTAELMLLDPSIHHTTAEPRKLLRNDGTVVRQIVESVRLPEPQQAGLNERLDTGALHLTLRSFLSSYAMRATHAMDDLDWCSSNNSNPCAVQAISVPTLVSAMTANNYLRFAEMHYALSASADKDLIYVEGALHGQLPCVACETFPGQYANTVANFFDYVAAWIHERY